MAQQADGFVVTFLLAGDLGLGEQDEIGVGLGVSLVLGEQRGDLVVLLVDGLVELGF